MFKKGQRVICIDTNEDSITNTYYSQKLEVNKIYIVEDPLYLIFRGIILISLKETGVCAWRATSFREIDENFAEEVLQNIKEQIMEEEFKILIGKKLRLLKEEFQEKSIYYNKIING